MLKISFPHKLNRFILSMISTLFFALNGELVNASIENIKEKTTMRLESPAFKDNGYIPIQFTGEGQDISPPLTWKNAPNDVRSFVLICHDPDAPGGNWDHWLLYNISPSLDHIEEGGKNLPPTARFGKNTWGKLAYGGPQPPSGVHHYHFDLYALDTVLHLKEGPTKDQIRRAMQGHILDHSALIGLYKSKRAH